MHRCLQLRLLYHNWIDEENCLSSPNRERQTDVIWLAGHITMWNVCSIIFTVGCFCFTAGRFWCCNFVSLCINFLNVLNDGVRWDNGSIVRRMNGNTFLQDDLFTLDSSVVKFFFFSCFQSIIGAMHHQCLFQVLQQLFWMIGVWNDAVTFSRLKTSRINVGHFRFQLLMVKNQITVTVSVKSHK